MSIVDELDGCRSKVLGVVALIAFVAGIIYFGGDIIGKIVSNFKTTTKTESNSADE